MTVLSSFERIYPSLNLHVSESDPRIQLNEDRTEINKENGSCYYGNRDPFVSRRIARRIATVCGRRNCASSQPWNRGLSSFSRGSSSRGFFPSLLEQFPTFESSIFDPSRDARERASESNNRYRAHRKEKEKKKRKREREKKRKKE